MTRLLSILFAACFCLSLSAWATPPGRAAAAGDKYDQLREKWANTLTGNALVAGKPADALIANKVLNLTKTADEYWKSLNKNAARTYLWPDLTSTQLSAEITYAYHRIYAMTLAYRTTGSALNGNPALREDIIQALEWMSANRYASSYNDWWDFAIGAPLELNNCLVLMHDELSAAQRAALNQRVAKFAGNPTTDNGANRAWRAFVYGLNGVLLKDSTRISVARNSLSGLLAFAARGEGFFEDGSFIQHTNHPYNLGYGVDALAKLTDLLELLDGSAWAVTDPNGKNVYRWVYHSFEPLVYRGVAMDMVRGREMARFYKEDYRTGFTLIGIVAKLAQFAPAPDGPAFRALVKHWVQANPQRDYFADAVGTAATSVTTIIQVRQIVDDPGLKPTPELVLYQQFAHMDRALKRGPGFGFGISMYSTRIANYEADIKRENRKGWHTGDGMTYLYNADLNQYSNNFWPTVDSYRLPGTTVLRATPSPSDQPSDRSWVGGASLADTYGATGMDYHALGHRLRAKKSWFMFDNEIVALGAGIAGRDNTAVETIIENRKLNSAGTNRICFNGRPQSALTQWGTDTVVHATSAHLAGSVPGADIGYYFPGGATLTGLRQARTASWNAVNGNPATSDTVRHTNNFLTLWLNHGTNPVAATYAYVLLPGFSSRQVGQYATRPEILILRNDTLVQAAQEKRLHLTGANFWTDTRQTVSYISCDKKASLMAQEEAGQLTVSVADPTQLNKGLITVTLQKRAKAILKKDAAITVVQLSPRVILRVNVSQAAGKTFTATLKL